jgi:hypothetical protein
VDDGRKRVLYCGRPPPSETKEFAVLTKTMQIRASFVLLVLAVTCGHLAAQAITEQKQVVAFLFGTVHPLNPDKTPIKESTNGHPLEVETPLGTGFFVKYPDSRGGPTYGFVYLVTAKHVLRDSDGTFLPKVKARLNLRKPTDDTGVDFINDIPVADAKGNLLWFQDEKDPTNETVVLPLLPDEQKFELRTVPIEMFVTEAQLKSDAVAEGDNLYFIGLMAQYYGDKRNYPVVRRGTLAMMTDEDIATPVGPQKAFIAELQSWPGNSGSPVFLSLGGLRGGVMQFGQRFSLLGLVLGTYTNKLSAPVVEDKAIFKVGVQLPIGISFIVPASRIREVLGSPAAQARRDTEIKAQFPAAK